MSQIDIAAVYADPSKRHDFVLLFDITLGNPNGDPDAGNLPRVDPETMHGIVTDVAIKRKVRNYAQLARKMPIFIQSEVSLNSLIVKGFRDSGVQPPQVTLADDDLIDWFGENNPEGFTVDDNLLTYGGDSKKASDIQKALLQDVPDTAENKGLRDALKKVGKEVADAASKQKIGAKERVSARERLCQDYYDVRTFGAVLGTGLNAGQVRGPMQLTFARSVDPIFQHNLTITRQARTTSARMATGATEMGRKPIIPYGLYRAHGFFSPHLAETTGVTRNDLAVFWEALAGGMWDFDRSAARPEMATQGLYVFTHENPLGNAPAHKLFDGIQVTKRSGVEAPRSFRDYEAKVIPDKDLPTSVTLTRLVGEVASVVSVDGHV